MDSYLNEAFQELLSNDGLVAMGKGLGVQRLFAKFVSYAISELRNRIVICVNSQCWTDYVKHFIHSEVSDSKEFPVVRFTAAFTSSSQSNRYPGHYKRSLDSRPGGPVCSRRMLLCHSKDSDCGSLGQKTRSNFDSGIPSR